RPSSLTRRPAGVMMVGTTNPFRADEIMKHLSCLFFLSITVVCVLLLPGGAARPAEQEPYDLVLRNGTVVDGSGNPWFRGDVAIRGGRLRRGGRGARRAGPPRDRRQGPGRGARLHRHALPLRLRPPRRRRRPEQGATGRHDRGAGRGAVRRPLPREDDPARA